MGINLKGKEKEINRYRNLILKAGKAALSFTGARRKSLSILLTDNQQMRKLNSQFRNVDSVTDVLSFPYGEKNSSYLGDVAISLPKAREQAKEYREELEDELARLVIHGILHLKGERDDTPKAKKRMWAKQEEILKLVKNQR